MGSFEYLSRICSLPHRGSGTRYEHEAAGIINRELRGLGYKVVMQEFKSPPGTLYVLPLEVGIPLVVLGIAALGTYVSMAYLIEFIICLALFLPLLMETGGFGIETNIMPKRKSYNVFTETEGNDKPKVIVAAHYDTQKGSFLFAPGFVDHLQMFYNVNYIGFVLIPVGILLSIFKPEYGRIALYAGLVVASIGLAVFLAAWLTGHYTPGANDNGTGTALALYLAEDYMKNSADYPDDADLIFLFTGSEEVGERGMAAYIKKYRPAKEDTYFIILDNLGTGRITYLEGEGMIKYYKAGKELIQTADSMKVKYPDIQKQHNLLLPTDSLPAMASGYHAISFLGKDEKGRLGNYHWYTDTIENVDKELLQKEEEFFKEYVIRVMEGGRYGTQDSCNEL
ncbi:MAG: M28 family peptidase [Thermoanaerobacteraceae bacterium]|nr:M28 family peptidase [Thermoanaerobacteraceae bacterium]